MTSVVSFLTMLERDIPESNGNVRRMLSVCAEFERIARVALDKAEREMRGRGKRKQAEREREKALKERVNGEVAQGIEDGKSLEQIQVETQAAYRRPVQTPSLRASVAGSQAGSNPANSPRSWGGSPPGGSGPEYQGGQRSFSNPTPRLQNSNLNQQTNYTPSQQPHSAAGPFNALQFAQSINNMEFGPNGSPQQQHFSSGPPPTDGFQQQQQQDQQHTGCFSPQQQQTSSGPDFGIPFDPINGIIPGGPNAAAAGAFQQPFVPQDLWQMPMTLEW